MSRTTTLSGFLVILAASLVVAVFVAGLSLWMLGAASAFRWLNQYSVWSATGILTDTVAGRHFESLRTVFRLLLSGLCLAGAFILFRQRKYGPLGLVILFVGAVPALVWLTGVFKPIFMHRTVLPSVIGVTISRLSR